MEIASGTETRYLNATVRKMYWTALGRIVAFHTPEADDRYPDDKSVTVKWDRGHTTCERVANLVCVDRSDVRRLATPCGSCATWDNHTPDCSGMEVQTSMTDERNI